MEATAQYPKYSDEDRWRNSRSDTLHWIYATCMCSYVCRHGGMQGTHTRMQNHAYNIPTNVCMQVLTTYIYAYIIHYIIYRVHVKIVGQDRGRVGPIRSHGWITTDESLAKKKYTRYVLFFFSLSLSYHYYHHYQIVMVMFKCRHDLFWLI